MKVKRTRRKSTALKSLQSSSLTFTEWLERLKESWPILLEAVVTLAALIMGTCETCHKPDSVLWMSTGDHELCHRLEDGRP